MGKTLLSHWGTDQTCNENIWGGSDDTETQEPLNNSESFLPANVDCPPIFEDTELPSLEDIIMTKCENFPFKTCLSSVRPMTTTICCF